MVSTLYEKPHWGWVRVPLMKATTYIKSMQQGVSQVTYVGDCGK